ncbi:hypothetical protein CCACVL1_29148 [Corchorus capsularis]|uniref:TF-B3 domain-containing protein n=1 Tax=Corchorus capsularis TaxID=210143 RepID=A0A1R3G3K0_COCAP|nr:hypothetical protein CCACVL1_29148 [Corchorus capsularis]
MGSDSEEDWSALHFLADVADAVAAKEDLEKEKSTKETTNKQKPTTFCGYVSIFRDSPSNKKPTSMREKPVNNNSLTFSPAMKLQNLPNRFMKLGFDAKDVRHEFSPKFSDNPFSKKPSLKEKSVYSKSSTFFLDNVETKESSETEGFLNQGLVLNERNHVTFSPRKQSFTGKEEIHENSGTRKRCFEKGETSCVKNPKPRKKKKCKASIFGSSDQSQPVLPERLKEMIKDMGGTDEKLIIEKSLYKTDKSETHCRLSIPKNQVRVEFLTDEEKKLLKSGSSNKERKSIEVLLIEPSLQTRKVSFKIWVMGKGLGKKACTLYVFGGCWKSVLKDNGLEINDLIQVWSFRVKSTLCFALVVVKRHSDNA